MARAHQRRSRSRASGRRRKTLWSESGLGQDTAARSNQAVATGWLAFPAGQYNTGFAIPAYQPEDLTHLRSIIGFSAQTAATPSVNRASSFSVAVGILQLTVEDGNVYQSTAVATSGVGGLPNPAHPSNFDWLWKYQVSICANPFALPGSWVTDQMQDTFCQTRAMRKLSHGTGLLWVMGWDWDSSAFAGNGDTLGLTAFVHARSIFKEP